MTVILGINAHHGDSSACILVDGRLIAAAEEERFRRVKHWAGFPTEAIRYCLSAAGARWKDVDHVALNRDPKANLAHKVMFALSGKTDWAKILDRLRNASRIRNIHSSLAEAARDERGSLRAAVHHVEHHRAHLASAFLVSPFDSAAVVSIDGFGDFSSVMWGEGRGNRIRIGGSVRYPHSLGLLYLAMTQYLGFPNYGDEYKVMGLAAYGKPTETVKLRRLLRLKRNGTFELNLKYFVHHTKGVSMTWDNGAPTLGPVFSPELIELMGPARPPGGPVDERHRNIASSLQIVYEETVFHLLERVSKSTAQRRLCLAGGCAMNSVANGNVLNRTRFRELYVQAAAGDAGGAIGAAFHVWCERLGKPRSFRMEHAYWGPEFNAEDIGRALASRKAELAKAGCKVDAVEDEGELCRGIAAEIAAGKIVGWFQGRMEWGPRALGNRSILCDPRHPGMKDILNGRIKHREPFRPFAPSVLREETGRWFETDYDVPFMSMVFKIRPEKRGLVPAVTHSDGTGRLQTVSAEQNPLYHRLISEFKALTGVPIVLNTSFNENEPIVCSPAEALDCFLRTRMDTLVLGNYIITRSDI